MSVALLPLIGRCHGLHRRRVYKPNCKNRFEDGRMRGGLETLFLWLYKLVGPGMKRQWKKRDSPVAKKIRLCAPNSSSNSHPAPLLVIDTEMQFQT